MESRRPIRVALTNDFELVVAGLARMLAGFDDRVTVVDTAVQPDTVDRRVDVALFDTFAHTGDGMDEIERLVKDPDVHRVAVFTWQFEQTLVDRALAMGCTGYLSKALDAEHLVAALEQVARGHQVVSADPLLDRHTSPERGWPGRADGLSERESEVLVLIAEGLSNLDIARSLTISPNSVKAHIRSGYRKLGVATRAQAVRAVLDRDMVRRR
jgi:DNA-binding NarL/FixJ family response regulator